MSSVSEYHETAPRRVSFGWSRTPLHRIPDEPATTHVIDVPHLPLSAGERWSVKVFNEGPVPVRDPELPDGVEGFRGQGATHGVRHAHVPDHLAAQPLGTADFTRYVDFLFERLLGERPPPRAPIRRSHRSVSGWPSSRRPSGSRRCSPTGSWPLTAWPVPVPVPVRSCSAC